MTLGTDGPVAAVEFVRDWLDEFPLLMLRQDIQIWQSGPVFSSARTGVNLTSSPKRGGESMRVLP